MGAQTQRHSSGCCGDCFGCSINEGESFARDNDAGGVGGADFLGILNVVWVLPLINATLHNVGGALLLITLVTVNCPALASAHWPMTQLLLRFGRLNMQSTAQPTWRDYLELCKPRVVLLMLLAPGGDVPRVSGFGTLQTLFFGLVGIGLVAGSAPL